MASTKNRQAEALLDSLRQFDLPYDPDIVSDELREQGMGPVADLVDSLQDQILELRVNLHKAKRKANRKRKRK